MMLAASDSGSSLSASSFVDMDLGTMAGVVFIF